MATYTVKKGDSLSSIARDNLSTIGASSIYGPGGGIDLLCKWNNISNPDHIVVGQVLQISDPGSGGGTTSKPNNTNRPIIELFGLQSNTENTIFASWKWDKDHTANYEVIWYYDTGDKIWFIGSKSTTEDKQATYSAPSNAKQIKFKVKAISETYRSNDNDVSYWTGDWSTERIYNISDTPPKQPSAPSVNLDKYTLTASLDNLDLNATEIYFEVVRDNVSVFQTGKAPIKTGHVEFTWNISAGHEYKVRCRSLRGNLKSDWSEYSENVKGIPDIPKISTIQGKAKNIVYLEWGKDNTATSYTIEYATRANAFDISDDTQTATSEFNSFELTLDKGIHYFFRVRATNESGGSPWSEIVDIILGDPPAAPTTWSASTTIMTGETVALYWMHNAKDGSLQTRATIQITANGETVEWPWTDNRPDDKKNEASRFLIMDTDKYLEGTQIKWRVRTAGITEEYGDWSIERTIDVFAPPSLELKVTDNNGQPFDTLRTFPFYIEAIPSPATQTPTGYHVSITANETYETADEYGNIKMVSVGDEVYAKQFNIVTNLLATMSAENITLENNISYTITCVVSMNSGLTTQASQNFKVAWTDEEYAPNAEIGIDTDNYTASIHPYVHDENGDPIEGIILSVYRREYDGGFVELAKNISNTTNTFITDPHPALDFARYRIVAKTEATGKVSYTDLAGYPVGGKAIIIQWDEDWATYDTPEASAMEQPTWSGSMLQLPYNIDVSDNNNPDTELVEYIGRSNPVSYYGTQRGKSASWSVVIDKEDKETLYALRRLSNYMGDAYVREPSGSGYWAHITVSFSQKHCEVTIPVTLDVTRVEGGV